MKVKTTFISTVIQSIKYAFKGIKVLVSTETNAKTQAILGILAILMGFCFSISATEWMVQILIIALVLVAETINTAIEKLADFVHPDYHEKIGAIKDISAGAPTFAALFSLIIASIIYIPKIIAVF
ncbi:MAG: diacylglycerol kinase family protein [Tenacibaculum sp.]